MSQNIVRIAFKMKLTHLLLIVLINIFVINAVERGSIANVDKLLENF